MSGKVSTKETSKNKVPSDPSDAVAGEALAEALKYLQDQWEWSGKELSRVLHIPVSTINAWLKAKYIPVSRPLSNDVQTIVALIAIHKNLGAMFERPESQKKWLMSPHPDMGAAPSDFMAENIEHLVGLRQYLDYARGRGA